MVPKWVRKEVSWTCFLDRKFPVDIFLMTGKPLMVTGNFYNIINMNLCSHPRIFKRVKKGTKCPSSQVIWEVHLVPYLTFLNHLVCKHKFIFVAFYTFPVTNNSLPGIRNVSTGHFLSRIHVPETSFLTHFCTYRKLLFLPQLGPSLGKP